MITTYFLSYIIGSFIIFAPDTFGRKKTMTWLLPFSMISTFLITFHSSTTVKQIGYFILAALHMKTTLAYCHASELVSEKHKSLAPTIISMVDSGSIMLSALYLLYVD